MIALVLESAGAQIFAGTGAVALALAVLAGAMRGGWTAVGTIGCIGGLVAQYAFPLAGSYDKVSNVSSNLVFNTLVFFVIAIGGYIVGHVLRFGVNAVRPKT